MDKHKSTHSFSIFSIPTNHKNSNSNLCVLSYTWHSVYIWFVSLVSACQIAMAGKYQCSEPKLQDLEIASLEFKMILSVAFFASVSSYHVFIAEHTETLSTCTKEFAEGPAAGHCSWNRAVACHLVGNQRQLQKGSKETQVAIAVKLKTCPQIWKHTYNQLHMQEFVLQGHSGIRHKPKNNPEIHNACIRNVYKI